MDDFIKKNFADAVNTCCDRNGFVLDFEVTAGIEEVEDIRHEIGKKEIYKKRKETIERVFEDAK